MTDTNNPYNSIGEYVSVLRRRANLSQSALAKRAGLSRTEISLIERDQVNWTLQTLQLVLSALGAEFTVRLTDKTEAFECKFSPRPNAVETEKQLSLFELEAVA